MSKRKKSKNLKIADVANDAQNNEDIANLATAASDAMSAFESNEDEEIEISEESSEELEMSEIDGSDSEAFEQIEDEEELSASEETLNETSEVTAELEGSELGEFEAAEIEEKEFIEDERIESIIESYLFATDRPVSFQSIRALFTGTQVTSDKVRKVIDRLSVEYAGAKRGVVLEEVSGGYQLRTKMDNLSFLKRSLKARVFKLSGPALEVLSIVAYKQPVIKNEIDQIRGVESGHLLRALMEKGLINFEGKSDLPGKPMQYATARKFLEIFGLRNLKELPSLSQIDELLPDGIGDEENDLGHLSEITGGLSENYSGNYSEGEEELQKIEGQLSEITTTSAFFEDEKRQKAEAKKASRFGASAAKDFDDESPVVSKDAAPADVQAMDSAITSDDEDSEDTDLSLAEDDSSDDHETDPEAIA